jgi:hypothetical protein
VEIALEGLLIYSMVVMVHLGFLCYPKSNGLPCFLKLFLCEESPILCCLLNCPSNSYGEMLECFRCGVYPNDKYVSIHLLVLYFFHFFLLVLLHLTQADEKFFVLLVK